MEKFIKLMLKEMSYLKVHLISRTLLIQMVVKHLMPQKYLYGPYTLCFTNYVTIREENMMLVGLWVSKTEPNMNLHLQPLVDQANELSYKGFKWEWNGQEIISKFYPLECCVDSVARCAMLNMKQYNGFYGCTYCEHPVEAVDGVRKYPIQESIPLKRTDKTIQDKMT